MLPDIAARPPDTGVARLVRAVFRLSSLLSESPPAFCGLQAAARFASLQGIKRKKFFFEKKNQKTFVIMARRCRNEPRQQEKSLLLLFFRKEGLSSLLVVRHRPSTVLRCTPRVSGHRYGCCLAPKCRDGCNDRAVMIGTCDDGDAAPRMKPDLRDDAVGRDAGRAPHTMSAPARTACVWASAAAIR